MRTLLLAAFWLIISFCFIRAIAPTFAADGAPCAPTQLLKLMRPPHALTPITKILTERRSLQSLDRHILKAIQKKGAQYSYSVDSAGNLHVFEGSFEIPEDAVWLIENTTTTEKPLQKFLAQDAGDLIYDKERREFVLQSRYKLGGSQEGHQDAIAFVKREFPNIELARAKDAKNSYEKVISCLDLSNKNHSGGDFVKTAWSSGNINFAMWEVAFNPLDTACDWELAAADYMGMAVRSPTSAFLSRKLVLDGASSLKLFTARTGLSSAQVGIQNGINHAVAAGSATLAKTQLPPEEAAKFDACQAQMNKAGTYNWGSLVVRSAAGFMSDRYLLNDAHRALFDACKKGGVAKLIITPTMMRLVEKNAMNALYWIPRKLYLDSE